MQGCVPPCSPRILASVHLTLEAQNVEDKLNISKHFCRSVAWIRGSDSHIITVDQETFISDDRFSSLIKTLDNLWTLKVRPEAMLL